MLINSIKSPLSTKEHNCGILGIGRNTKTIKESSDFFCHFELELIRPHATTTKSHRKLRRVDYRGGITDKSLSYVPVCINVASASVKTTHHLQIVAFVETTQILIGGHMQHSVIKLSFSEASLQCGIITTLQFEELLIVQFNFVDCMNAEYICIFWHDGPKHSFYVSLNISFP